MGMGVLAIIPIPPLDGGKLLFTLVPRKGVWQKARYRLDEENWGLLVLRLVMGGSFIFHGAEELFGAFGGRGIEAFTRVTTPSLDGATIRVVER